MAAIEGLEVRAVTEFNPELATNLGNLRAEAFRHDNNEPGHEDLIREIIAQPNSDLFIAELSGRLVGSATVNVIPHPWKRKAFFDYFMVSDTVRGRGVGFALWQAAGAWCLDRDIVQMNLTSDFDMVSGHEFYSSHGAIIRDTAFFEKIFTTDDLQ